MHTEASLKAGQENDPLMVLQAFDRLEVGPVKLEPRRLVAPYRLVIGDHTKATVHKGQKMWAVMIANLTAFVDQLKTMTLEEIYQKQY